jgi:hypothetical protein
MLDIQINLAHSGAVREEIGERLAIAVGTPSDELPARLLGLMDRLAKAEFSRDVLSSSTRDLSRSARPTAAVWHFDERHRIMLDLE